MTENELKWFRLGKLLRRNLLAGVKENPMLTINILGKMMSYGSYVCGPFPKYDKEKYPYAYIHQGFGHYGVIASKPLAFYSQDVDGTVLLETTENTRTYYNTTIQNIL